MMVSLCDVCDMGSQERPKTVFKKEKNSNNKLKDKALKPHRALV